MSMNFETLEAIQGDSLVKMRNRFDGKIYAVRKLKALPANLQISLKHHALMVPVHQVIQTGEGKFALLESYVSHNLDKYLAEIGSKMLPSEQQYAGVKLLSNAVQFGKYLKTQGYTATDWLNPQKVLLYDNGAPLFSLGSSTGPQSSYGALWSHICSRLPLSDIKGQLLDVLRGEEKYVLKELVKIEKGLHRAFEAEKELKHQEAILAQEATSLQSILAGMSFEGSSGQDIIKYQTSMITDLQTLKI